MGWPGCGQNVEGSGISNRDQGTDLLWQLHRGRPSTRPEDSMAPLRRAIDAATHLTEAVAKEIQDPSEERLRDLARKLGTAKKEIMGLSRSLMVGRGPGSKRRDRGQQDHQRCRGGHQVKPRDNKGSPERVGGGFGHIGGQRPHQGSATSHNEACTGRVECGVGDRGPAGGARVGTLLHTCHDCMAPPPEPVPRPKMGGTSKELTTLMQGLMGAQANDSGWPTFSGKYVEYPRFRKEWWAYRQTYHGHVCDELVCRSLKETDQQRSAAREWNTLDTCFDRPEKYISEALDPVVKFRSYKAFYNGAIRQP
jgi:hypothetical protein